MILLKSIKIKNKGSKISKTRAREGGASVFPFFLFPKAAAPVNLAIQQAGKKEGGLGGKSACRQAGNFCPPAPKAKPRRPARSEQSPAKKFSFPFRRKSRARANKKL